MSQTPTQNTGPNPPVSVIIVTRNRPAMVRRCLAHLRRQTYDPFETIVVDGSSDKETEKVVASYPSVHYIYLPNGKNKMTQARNLGIAAAGGEIIAFIDDDSLVGKDWLPELVSAYHDPTVGGVGGRVVDDMERNNRVAGPTVGKVFPDGRTVDNFILELDQIVEVDRFKGCNMSFRKEALQQVGLFDVYYTTTWDDVDICTRIKKQGYRLLFNSRAVVDHLIAPQEDGLVRSTTNPQVMAAYYRHRTYFVLTHFGRPGRHLAALFWSDTMHHLYLFLKNPSRNKLLEVGANIQGKLTGTAAAIKMQWRGK